MKALVAISTALLLALCLSSGFHLDDHSGESAAAADAIKELRVAARFYKAAQEQCGENASYRMTSDTEFTCVTKRGFVTALKGQL